MKEEFCCNCHWYDGVHGCQGCAECKIKHEIVLWSDCCDHLWLIPERLKIGLKTNSDLFRAKSDEELAKTISGDQIYPWCAEDEPCKYDSCTDCVLAWLKQEVSNDK